jgi:hypothetical protein
MQAPLGLAVIGGLVMSTFATLLVLPSIFVVVIGRKVFHTPSIYPDDRDSTHFDPLVYAEDGHAGHESIPAAKQSGAHDLHGNGNGHTPNGLPADQPGAPPEALPLPGGV